MAKGKGRVRVETNQESPRTYDVDRGEEVTVKTRHEKPEVTGGGGGGGGGDFGCSEAIVGLIIVIALLIYAIRGCIYAVETYVIKGINPNYITSFEVAEEERKQKEIENALKREAERKKQLTKEDIENKLAKNGKKFYSSDYCVIENCIWSCGSLLGEIHSSMNQNGVTTNYYPAVSFSEDSGNNYIILWEKRPLFAYWTGQIDYYQTSKIKFLNKNDGFLLVYWSYGSGASYIYKTENGGRDWKTILEIGSTPVEGLYGDNHKVADISTTDAQHITVSLNKRELMKSDDCGKSWSFIKNKKTVAWTRDKGLTWNTK